MDKNNLDQKQLGALLAVVSKKLGVPAEQLKNELEEGKFDSALGSLSGTDAAKFRQAVRDPQMVERLMSTPQAQALYRKLTGAK